MICLCVIVFLFFMLVICFCGLLGFCEDSEWEMIDYSLMGFELFFFNCFWDMEIINCWGFDKRNMGVLDIEDKWDVLVILM